MSKDLKMNTWDADSYVYKHASKDSQRPIVMLELVKANVDSWTEEEMNDFIIQFWNHCNHTTSVTNTWLELFKYLTYCDNNEKQIKSERSDDNWMPLEDHDGDNFVKLYRGASSPKGLSWTFDFEIAQKFARRNSESYFSNNTDQTTIWQTAIHKDDILFINNTRGELEAVIDWTKGSVDGAVDVVWFHWRKAYIEGQDVPDVAIKRYNLTQYKHLRKLEVA
jgi:hypothetical protein